MNETLCEARFSNVEVPPMEGGLIDLELREHPKEVVGEAYHDLMVLGDWRHDSDTLRKHGDHIAQSLYTIARAKEIADASSATILPDYYRLARVLPETHLAVEALARIAVLEGEKGMAYATEQLATRPAEDGDRFHLAVMRDCCVKPETPARGAAIEAFVQYVAKGSRFTLIEQIVNDLELDQQGISVCKSLIERGMAHPSSVQAAVVGLRYMTVKSLGQQDNAPVQELLRWAAVEFKETKLETCATAALADTYYSRQSYDDVVKALQLDLTQGNHGESQMVDEIENALVSYRANTLLQGTVNPERIYEVLSRAADSSEAHVVDLHCQRKIAETKGGGIESFKQSAQEGVKYCDSDPEDEVWFWRGLIAACEGDLGTASLAYERFLQRDNKSILAARAYYDIARTKMAMGEDAAVWITKAKALSPCDMVVKLERQLRPSSAARN